MKLGKIFAFCSALLLLAFGLYVLAPVARARFQPTQPPPAQPLPPPVQTEKPETNPAKPEAAVSKPKKDEVRKSWTVWHGHSNPSPREPVVREPYVRAAAAVMQPQTPAPAPPVAELPVDYEQLSRSEIGLTIETFVLLPGQELSITNPQYNYVEVTADFPADIAVGNCEAANKTKFDCRNVSLNSPIVVRDLRVNLPPDTSPRNRIQIKGFVL